MGISTTLRMTGLASGMDTESMVKAMTMQYKNKVDYAQQDKALMELKKEAWKNMNTKVYSFYTKTLNDFKFKSTYGKSEVAVSDSSIISVPKDVNLPAGTHTIEVEKIAKGAVVSSSSIKFKKDETEALATGKTSLKDLGFAEGDKVSIIVGGKTVEVEVKDVTKTDADGKVTTGPMTIDDFAAQIKNQMSTEDNKEAFKDINFNFDEKVGAFIINSKKTGKSQKIELSVKNSKGTVDNSKLEKLGITGGEEVDGKDKGGNSIKVIQYTGQNASYTYNGGVVLESESNTVDINGLKCTIIGESKGKPVTIAAVKDTQATVDVVKNFVVEYNKLIDEMNILVDAPSARKYRPLTSEQKKEMSEDDIKLWNEKVNGSILRGDSVLRELSSEMRNTVETSELFKMGVNTENWKEKGKIYINEDKLKEMIEQDPEEVDRILKDVGTKLYDAIGTRLKGNKDKSSNFLFNDKILNEKMTDQDDKISKLEDLYARQEDMYYKKFAAMEKMMSQLNSQSNWLSSQLGGM